MIKLKQLAGTQMKTTQGAYPPQPIRNIQWMEEAVLVLMVEGDDTKVAKHRYGEQGVSIRTSRIFDLFHELIEDPERIVLICYTPGRL